MVAHVTPDRLAELVLDVLTPLGGVGVGLVTIDTTPEFTPEVSGAFAAGVSRHVKRTLCPLSIHDDLPQLRAWRQRRALYVGTRAEIMGEFPLYRCIDPSVQSMAALVVGTETDITGAVSMVFDRELGFQHDDRVMLTAVADLMGSLLCPYAGGSTHPEQERSDHPDQRHGTGQVIRIGGLEVDAAGCQAWVDQQPVRLATREFQVLTTLIKHCGQVLSKQQLLDLVWGYQGYNPNVVEAQISSLRAKLGSAASLIETVRGLGYVIRRGGGRPQSKGQSRGRDHPPLTATACRGVRTLMRPSTTPRAPRYRARQSGVR